MLTSKQTHRSKFCVFFIKFQISNAQSGSTTIQSSADCYCSFVRCHSFYTQSIRGIFIQNSKNLIVRQYSDYNIWCHIHWVVLTPDDKTENSCKVTVSFNERPLGVILKQSTARAYFWKNIFLKFPKISQFSLKSFGKFEKICYKKKSLAVHSFKMTPRNLPFDSR